jgi:hypothetical protein
VGGPVIDDPEHPVRAGIRLGGHHLFHQPGERRDPGAGLAPAGDPSAVHVPGGQVGQRAAAVVVVLDPHRAGFPWRQGGVAAAPGLDGGLFIGADHIVAGAQRPAVPGPGVQVQHRGGPGREGRVADGYPGPVLPGLEGVAGQPPADGGGRDRDAAAGGHFAGQVRAAPPRQRHPGLGRQRAGQRDDFGPVRSGEHRRAAAARGTASPASRPAANRRRHLRTVPVHTLSSAAIAALSWPAAAASTIAARSRSRQGPRTDRARAVSTACSSPERTIWHGLGKGMRSIRRNRWSLCRTRASARHQANRDGARRQEKMTAVARYPDSTKASLEQRLRARARDRWPQITGLHIRHRGTFSYVDAILADGTMLKLCRLRYAGSASQWQFAIYRASQAGVAPPPRKSGRPRSSASAGPPKAAPRRRLQLRRRLPPRQPLGRLALPRHHRPRQRPPPRRPHPRPALGAL